MRKEQTSMLLTFLGLLLVIGSIAVVAFIDRRLSSRQLVNFQENSGDSLVGAYIPGTYPLGVLLLEGFGSDQVSMTSLASEYARMGWHVFTFDFSGHGRSPGALNFNNAQTDRLATQALAALKEFKDLSGLRADQIFVLGHSLGARVALQSATLNTERVAGLALLGTQVNLSTNVQSEFFTGTADTDLPWVQGLGPANPPVPILLISGAWDDILTPENARQLFERLGGEGAETYRKLVILPALVHNYEPFSTRALFEVTKWTGGITSESASLVSRTSDSEKVSIDGVDRLPIQAAVRIACWLCGLAGFFLLLTGAKGWALTPAGGATETLQMEVSSIRRFLWGKLLLWLGALPVAAVLGSLFFILPMAKPVFNLIYVGFIGGYGILLFILYWRGRMPGARGKLPLEKVITPVNKKRILAALGIAAGTLLLTAAYAQTGWFYIFPINIRLAWLVIFTPFTALGFWIGLHETQMLSHHRGARLAQALIGLFPFFLYTLLMVAIGSLSGMIGGLQGLVILWLVLVFGDLVQAVGRHTWITAISMAVLLYWLILPQGVLF